MSNSDLIRRLRDVDNWWPDGIEAADALETAEAQLKMVLDREAATTARYDAKLDAAEAEVARLREALEEAVEFAEQDFQALTPKGKVMIEAWRAALKEAKHE